MPPKLPLTPAERRAFRVARISSAAVTGLTGKDLHTRLAGALSRPRCDELAALADFQRLGSIGLEMARDFVLLGFTRVADLKGQDPRALHTRLSKLTRSRQDLCVEHTFRCAIAQAEDPDLPPKLRNWWHWTSLQGQPSSARPSPTHAPSKPPKRTSRIRRTRVARLTKKTRRAR